jgi:hypothetical protein
MFKTSFSVRSFNVGGLIGGAISGIGSMIAGSDAANAQEQAAQTAAQVQWKMFNTAYKGEAPWRNAGGTAVTEMMKSLTPGGKSDYTQTPGYLFNLAQGTQAANQSAASQGMLLSGQQQKALTQYGQGAATSDYQSYLNNLATVSGQGSGVATSGGNQAVQTGSGLAGSALYGGQARASGYLMQNAAMQQGIGNLYNTTSNWFGGVPGGGGSGGGGSGGSGGSGGNGIVSYPETPEG